MRRRSVQLIVAILTAAVSLVPLELHAALTNKVRFALSALAYANPPFGSFRQHATSSWLRKPAHAKLVQVDIDPAELHKNDNADLVILSDVKLFLQALLQRGQQTLGNWRKGMTGIRETLHNRFKGHEIGVSLKGGNDAAMARALGAFGEQVVEPQGLRGAVDRALAHPGPSLLDVAVKPLEARPWR